MNVSFWDIAPYFKWERIASTVGAHELLDDDTIASLQIPGSEI